MKPNSKTQMDPNLDFDGMAKESPGRIRDKLMTNQWSGHMNDGRDVNFGRGPTKGNQDYKNTQGGKSVTKDAFRPAPTDAMPSSTKIKNPDYINGGAQVRNPGGTRAWDPKAGQNYSGNPDRIRIGQNGGPDYGRTDKSRTPPTDAGKNTFNYGPRSQY
jgi:hypothetical protein